MRTEGLVFPSHNHSIRVGEVQAVRQLSIDIIQCPKSEYKGITRTVGWSIDGETPSAGYDGVSSARFVDFFIPGKPVGYERLSRALPLVLESS